MDQEEKLDEIKNDVKEPCGCYILGDFCYDKEGNPTHGVDEECKE